MISVSLLTAEDHPEGHTYLVAPHRFLVRDGMLRHLFRKGLAGQFTGRGAPWHPYSFTGLAVE
jgi:hypothetical protein